MTPRMAVRQRVISGRGLLLLLLVTALTGCVRDAEVSRAMTEFAQGSTALAAACEGLLREANTVEYEHFVDGQVFERKPLLPREIEARAVISPAELRVRGDAVLAIARYDTALASLASGQPVAKLTSDAEAASAALGLLTTQMQTTGAARSLLPATPSYSGAVSAAAAGAGEVLKLIEQHRSRAAIRESLRRNDPALNGLFSLLAQEATEAWERQRSASSAERLYLLTRYNDEVARPAPDAMLLLELGDRIKAQRRQAGLLGGRSPAVAIAAWRQSHDDLVAVLLAGGAKRPGDVTALARSVDDFLAAVGPLAANVQAMQRSM